MPIIKKGDFQTDESDPNLKRTTFINADVGGQSLTVGEVTIAPGSKIPLHIHPTHEEGILILEGTLDGVLGEERRTVEAGDIVLAPTGVKHELANNSQRPAKIMFIFPTTDVQRQFLE